jgi:acyl-coenzyme A thioesterase PaaI-like protein
VHPGFVTLALDELAVEMLLHEGVPNVSTQVHVVHEDRVRPGEEIVLRARRGRTKANIVQVEVEALTYAPGTERVVARGTIACVHVPQQSPSLRARRTAPVPGSHAVSDSA